jgi:hypothetical protein
MLRGRPPTNEVANAGQVNPSKVHRRKRNRYVLRACNRCKAAKVRCDGGQPCGYCVGRGRDTCYYSSSLQQGFQNEPASSAATAQYDLKANGN